MKAGAATVDITPEPGIELAGYAARVQTSTSVHDPLYLRCLYLEHEGRRLCWLHADLIGFCADLVHRICRELQSRLGLRHHEVVLSATHTHAGPPTIELLGCGRLHDAAYLDRIVAAAVEASQRAIEQAVPAEVWEGAAACELAIDRRHRERGTRTDEVVALVFRQTGELMTIAVLANYAIHPVSLNHKNRSISADLAGVAATRVRRAIPEAEVLVTNGACGDLNPPRQGDDFGATEEFGTTIAHAVLEAVAAATKLDPTLESRAIPMLVAVEPMDETEIRNRAQQVRDDQADKDPKWAANSLQAADLWEQRMLAHLPLRAMELAVNEVEICGRRFFCFGAEVLSKMSKDLKAIFGPRTTVVGYANGNIGYLCPEEAHDEGGYEPDLAFIYYGTPKIARGAFEEVVRKLSSRLTTRAFNP